MFSPSHCNTLALSPSPHTHTHTHTHQVMEKYRGAFPADVYTLENYMWAHAIMDSRSIWWGGGRHLTPMLDMINCMEGPGKYASRVHSTKLDAAGTSPLHLI